MTVWEVLALVADAAALGIADSGEEVPDRIVIAGWEPAADCDGLYVWLIGTHTSDQPTLEWAPGTAHCIGIPVARIGVRYDRCITVREGPPSPELHASEGEPFVAASEGIYRTLLTQGLSGAFCDCRGFHLEQGVTEVQGAIASFQAELAVPLEGGA